MKTRTINKCSKEDFELLIEDMRKDGEIIIMSELLDNGTRLITYKDGNEPDEQEVYDYGLQIGTDIATNNIHDLVEQFFWQEKTIDDLAGELSMIEIEHFRQYSPFEFFAKELNDSDDPDYLWDKYEDGVYQGIQNVIESHRAEAGKEEW